ncbi:flavonoid 3',5'-hydroxylase CYP75B138-like [Cryptomeria japonica]|uniref:flavonoid 3',5'-hydroxylase CYP75B138-like n=1 Tax=Cryptomeria japonica TaxID=3369 RepID=UPI0025ACD637|nr:flavonoid 3',5'-hydroxylase CYP75B138-like [Cryptomeria japonica]
MLSHIMLTAATETSATTVESAMTELLRNPKVMARAQQEIEFEVGRDRIVRESDLVNLNYLLCVVKETFRLHPPGPLLVPHESTQGWNVGEYYIPPKTRLFVSAWAMGRDKSVWEDALEFKPERFIGVGFFAHLPLDNIRICHKKEEPEQQGVIGVATRATAMASDRQSPSFAKPSSQVSG